MTITVDEFQELSARHKELLAEIKPKQREIDRLRQEYDEITNTLFNISMGYIERSEE